MVSEFVPLVPSVGGFLGMTTLKTASPSAVSTARLA